jgi:glycosyltransferase involved in cell wall biosynthesis
VSSCTPPQRRRHFGLGGSLKDPGGTNRCIEGIAGSQIKMGAFVSVVDEINGKSYSENNLSKKEYKDSEYFTVNHFHFSWTFFQINLLNKHRFESDINLFHFHGPWFLESKIETSKKFVRNKIKYLIEDFSYQNFPKIFADSAAFRDLLTREFKYPEENIVVAPLGVDLEKFSFSSEVSLNRDHTELRKVIGTVRRLVPRMGIENLIGAMRFLPNYELQIAGSGPSKATFEKLIEELRLGDRVKLVGYLPDSDLPKFYRSLDLMVIPSTKLEGFGLVALESFACGVPVIASDVDGLRESVGKFSLDLLFKPESEMAIVTKVEEYFQTEKFKKTDFRIYAEQNSWNQTTSIIENEILSIGNQ